MISRGLSSRKRSYRQNKHNSILLESYSLSTIPRSTSIEATFTASCDSTDKHKLKGFLLNTYIVDMFGFTDLGNQKHNPDLTY